MTAFVVLTGEELELEEAADALIRGADHDADCPAYTERQLGRRGARLVVRAEALAELAAAPPQPLRDEIRFLAAASRLTAELRACLLLWVDGWSQQEIALRLRVTQQAVSDRLRRALTICYDAAPISFRLFSHHSVYRPPSRGRRDTPVARCARCGEEVAAGPGRGRYCGSQCREAARHERRQPARNSRQNDSK